MKRLALLLVSFVMGASILFAIEPVVFNVGIIDETTLGPGHGKAPLRIPNVTLDDNVLTFEAFHPDYTLTLFNEEGEEVYQTAVLSSTDTVVLPSTLSGDYTLTLDFGGSYYFWSEITI